MCVRFLTNYDVVEGNYDVGESPWNYLVCTKNKYLGRNQHTQDDCIIVKKVVIHKTLIQTIVPKTSGNTIEGLRDKKR